MQKFRVGVDIGGTFTDIIFLGDDGQRIWASTMANSRRKDMPHHPFQNHPDYSRIDTYTVPDYESQASLTKDTIALAESLRK